MKPLKLVGPSLFIANLLVVLAIWSQGAQQSVTVGDPGAQWLLSLGRLCGLLAFYLVLWQALLITRVAWLERAFGHDRLSRLHHRTAFVVLGFIAVHPMLLIVGSSWRGSLGLVDQFLLFITEYPNVIWALVAWLMFVSIIGVSLTIVRRRLKYEWWYAVHFLMYGAITLSFLHQYEVGLDLAAADWRQQYWFSLVAVVAANIGYYRFTLPSLRTWWYGYRIEKVVAETPNVTSVYISGRRLGQLPWLAGQFILVRFLAWPWWLEAHPFTVSLAPNGRHLRLTAKAVGDYTATLAQLPVGARVYIDGPHGRFVSAQGRPGAKALFIAGGIGITPLRALFEEYAAAGRPVDLVYAARTPADFALQGELNALATATARVHYVPEDSAGRLTPQLLRRHAPDVAQRDVFLCGPPAMMAGVRPMLAELGVPAHQVHFEKFQLG